MSRNLHNTDYIFQPKRGLAEDLNTTASKNSAVTGELAYTTDRKQLWVFNGSEYEEVNKYPAYFYNSSGSQSGNRFNSWADLMDSVDGREVRIQFEQDETIPTGAWDVSFQTWVGNGQNPGLGGVIITIPTGVTFTGSINWTCISGIDIRSTSTSPIVTTNVPTSYVFDRTDIRCSTAEFFKFTGDGLYAFSVGSGFGFKDGGYEVVNVDGATDYGAIVVIVEQDTDARVEDDTVRSVDPIVYLHLKQSSEARTVYATQTNIEVTSVQSLVSFANAAVIAFPDGNPAGISSDNVYDALAELAAPLALGTGVSGSFTTVDGKTVTVTDGIITAIV